MQSIINQSLWFQFGASLDMLRQAITQCPDDMWNTETLFWYKAYHAIFWADYYLSEQPQNFDPLTPFTLSEMDTIGIMPPTVYTKTALLVYINHCKQKAEKLIAGLTETTMQMRFKNEYRDYSRYEIVLYNMRHIQHHTGQLYLLLRQANVGNMQWVSRVDE
jgi:DinB family